MNKYPNLCSPLKVGAFTYPHRIVASPIYCGNFCMVPGMDRTLRDGMIVRAKGGCAQITFGETPVDADHANRESFPVIDCTKYEGKGYDSLQEIVTQCHKYGTITLIELSHCGASTTGVKGAGTPIGPCGGKNEAGIEVTPMDRALMDECRDNFVQAARFMKAVGFDGVLLHAGHGWLLHQFLSPRTNKRTDEYGGSLKNRARYPLEVIAAVREAMGPDFLLEIRVSGEECEPGGMNIGETVEFCKLAEPYVDLIHVSVGTYRNPVLSGEFSSMYQPHGLNAEAGRAVKQAVNVPVTLVGGITSPELAEALIAGGACDLVALGRPLTADPEFANKVLSGRADDISQCVRCFKCFPGVLEDTVGVKNRVRGCTVNPYHACTEDDLLSSTPAASRNVLVVGGGAAGMQAAITAADRGHQVTLCERSGQLGGLLHFTDSDLYKTDLHNFMELLIRRVEQRNIRLLLHTEVTPENIGGYQADAVIVAIGSEKAVPPIPGIEHAIHAIDAYDQMEQLGNEIIMLGGGLVGCEVGLHLAKSGKLVTIIEMGDRIAAEAYATARMGLLDEMEKQGVRYHTGLRCTSIEPRAITAADKEGFKVRFAGSSVVFALGMKANPADALLKAAAPASAEAAGDCIRAARVFEACREGMLAATRIT